MLALNGGSKDDLEIHPNVWAGVGLVRGGAGTALVGSHKEVADRIEEYHSVGIDGSSSGLPSPRGRLLVRRGRLPILAERGLWTHPARSSTTTPRCPSRRPAGRRPRHDRSVPRVAVVVGNPRPASRTLAAGLHVARELTGRSRTSWSTSGPSARPSSTGRTPTWRGWSSRSGPPTWSWWPAWTYKATYTGLLKVFLDRFAGGTGLRGVVVPLMLGAGPGHSLAPSAQPPAGAVRDRRHHRAGHYVLEDQYDDPAAYADWLGAVCPTVSSCSST